MHQGVQLPTLWHPTYGREGVSAYLRRTRTVAAGGITDPTDVANCELWLAANNIVSLADGDPVGTWNDESGNARDATQSTAGNKPTYKTGIINSLPVVRFDAFSVDYMTLPNFMSGFTAGETFWVVKLDLDPPTGSARTGPPLGDAGSAADTNHYTWTDSVIYEDFGSTARKTVGDPTPSLASWRLIDIWSASNDWQFNIDGASQFSTATNTVGFGTAPMVGASSPPNYSMDGDIAEIIVYSRKLTTTERTNVFDYLNTKYALGL